MDLADDHLTLVAGDHTLDRAGELGPVIKHKVPIEETNPTHGITDHDQLLSAHRGRHKLTVQVDAVFDVVVGRAWKLAVSHTRWTDPSG